MSPSGAEVIRQIKSQIEEVDPSEVKAHARATATASCSLDVRESEEWDAGPHPRRQARPARLPRVAHRGRRRSDRSQRVVLYCASGQRSALAANTLKELLGYENVASMNGGITLWKDRGYDVEVPRVADQGAARALLAPPARAGDRARGPDEAARREGAAARRRRPRLADRALPRRRRRRHARASSTTTSSTSPTSSARSSTRPTGSARRRSTPPRARSTRINPDVKVVKYQTRLDASNIMEIIEGYDVIVDGVDNFPTRYLLNDATVRLRHPGRQRLDPRLRRPAVGLRAARRPVLPLPVPGAAAGRAGAVLRRQRRARRAAGHDGPAAGDRGRQARRRRGRAADRPPAALRSARRDVHRAQGPPRPGVPDLLDRPVGDHRRRDGRVPRLRGVLRRRGLGCRAAMAKIKIPPVLRPSVGGEKEVAGRRRRRRRRPARARRAAPRDPVAALRRRRRSSTATSTSTSTTRTSASSTGSDTSVGESRHARDPAGHGRRRRIDPARTGYLRGRGDFCACGRLSIGEILDAGIKVVVRHWRPLTACDRAVPFPLAVISVLASCSSIDPDAARARRRRTRRPPSARRTRRELGGARRSRRVAMLDVLPRRRNIACFKVVGDAWLGATPRRAGARCASACGARRGPAAHDRLERRVVLGVPADRARDLAERSRGRSRCRRCCSSASGRLKALGRSFGLVKGRWWATFLIMLVCWLLVGAPRSWSVVAARSSPSSSRRRRARSRTRSRPSSAPRSAA